MQFEIRPSKIRKARIVLAILGALALVVLFGFILFTFVVEGIRPQLQFVNPSNGHTYLMLEPCVWCKAEEKAVSLGGHLVTINDTEENQWICDTVLHNPDNILANAFDRLGTQIHIGYYKNENGAWRWINGEISDYVNWGPGEPNNVNGPEDWGTIFTDDEDGHFGQWNDSSDGWRRALIEIPKPEQ